MTMHSKLPFSRRELLKAGGVLVVGFSMGGTASPAAAARGDAAGPPDPSTIDSWIAVHADNTATIYLGKGEFGQGNTTGLLQIAGEELDLDIESAEMGQARYQRVAEPGCHRVELIYSAGRPASARGRCRGAPGAIDARLEQARRTAGESPRSPRAWCPLTATPAAP